MNIWDKETELWLLTEEEFSELPNGTTLLSISGKTATKGLQYIDMDTRFGYLAYGLTPELAQQSEEVSRKFIIWKLQV